MKLIAAYLLASLGENASPSAADVKKILKSVGIEADEDRLKTLVADLKGKDINEVCMCVCCGGMLLFLVFTGSRNERGN